MPDIKFCCVLTILSDVLFLTAILFKFFNPYFPTTLDIREEFVPEELVYVPSFYGIANEALAYEILHFWGPSFVDRDLLVYDCV